MEKIWHHNKPARRAAQIKLSDWAWRLMIREAIKRPKVTLKELEKAHSEHWCVCPQDHYKLYTSQSWTLLKSCQKRTLLRVKNLTACLEFTKRHAGDSPNTLKELEQFYIKEWEKIPVARCAKTYPWRLAAMSTAKGDSTKY